MPQPSPRGKAKKSHLGNDNDLDKEECTGIYVTPDEMKLASPSEVGKPRWGWCFHCGNAPFCSQSLIVFDCKVFHSEQCLEKFKAEIVHPTPNGADLTGIVDYVVMAATTKPLALVFDSPTRAATAAKAATAAAAKSKTPPKQKLVARRRRPPRRPRGLPPDPVIVPAGTKLAWPTVEFSETTQLFVDRVPMTERDRHTISLPPDQRRISQSQSEVASQQ